MKRCRKVHAQAVPKNFIEYAGIRSAAEDTVERELHLREAAH
jgi:hypothetical protein